MENTQNFEQYKKDQEELGKIPQIKPDFHFILDEISKKILSNESIDIKEANDLEIVFDMVQDLDKELISSLDTHRGQKIISKLEFLVTSGYFLTSEQNGPESSDIRGYFKDGYLSVDEFVDASSHISIPENTRKVLIETYKKIFDFKKGSVS